MGEEIIQVFRGQVSYTRGGSFKENEKFKGLRSVINSIFYSYLTIKFDEIMLITPIKNQRVL